LRTSGIVPSVNASTRQLKVVENTASCLTAD
jgi:hypothetical protein